MVVAADGRTIGYGELVAAELLHVDAQPTSKLKPADKFREMGKPRQRVDIPAKVTGAAAYVQDMRLEGMLHARIVRPPSPGAVLKDLDFGPVEIMPGVVKVVRNGSFLAVAREPRVPGHQGDASALGPRAMDRAGPTSRHCQSPGS